MATTKKGKKPSKPKTGSKPKKKSKKNTSGNVFSKMMLIILLLAILATATFMILKNFEVNKSTRQQDNETEINFEKKDATDESRKQKPEIKETVIKEETSAEKKEIKKEEVAPKEEVKSESKKGDEGESESEVKTEPKPEVVDLKKEFKENHSISGCWLSSSQGASLTLDDYGYRIDFFGVDASQPMTGKYSAENNQIIFFTEEGDCKGIKGIYRISFNKKNISLTCKDDDCKKRKSVMEADWEWIEI